MLPGALALAAPQTRESGGDAPLPNRPKVPGTLGLRARTRGEQPPGRRRLRISEKFLRWEVAQTAIIICDMWDTHTCNMSTQRVAAMAPRMNQVVSASRSLGVMIIHAPSDTMKFYEGTPQRQRMQRAPMASSPTPILPRCGRNPEEERNFPVDDTAGGCDDPIVKPWTGPWPWTRENSAIDVVGFDGVMGVHTNICILNRGYGIRQMTKLGFHVVLVRDLTDTMYDPRTRPFVSHVRGTELVIEHIESRWCPSVMSDDLTRVISGTDSPASVSMAAGRRS